MKKVVIFDFDYTLGDSSEGIIASINYALDKMGIQKPGRDKAVKTIGMSLGSTYEILSGRNSASEKEEFEKYFKEKADEVMVSNTFLYNGVVEMLKNLHAKGLKTAIVTTKYHYRIGQILKVNNATSLIDGVIGGDDVTTPKPSPEGINKIKEQFNVHLEEILYAGDSIVDAEAAQGAGVDFLAVLTGTTPYEAFKNYPYASIINSITDIEGWNYLL